MKVLMYSGIVLSMLVMCVCLLFVTTERFAEMDKVRKGVVVGLIVASLWVLAYLTDVAPCL